MLFTLGWGAAGLDWVYIHSCGNGHLGFRFYSGSLGKTERRPPRGARKSKAKAKAKAKARRPYRRPDCRCVCDPIVGASLLAMDFQAPRSSRRGALSLTSIASRLAPTGDWGYPQRSGRL
ncbi:hypothetical protein F6476_12855 [Pseudomonas umsongensis]|nr:hypothetical protein F6476_12855 [Pseudomonas umsongensis]